MTIQLKEDEPCKVVVNFLADSKKVIDKREEISNEFLKSVAKVRIPGFRKGKAPLFAIKNKYNKEIEKNLEQVMIQEAEKEVLFETKMKTLFTTHVLHSFLKDSLFECELLFFKKPDVKLNKYKGFDIPKPHSTQTPEQIIEADLQKVRMEFGDTIPFSQNDTAQLNDKITMNVKCTVDDKEITELSKNDTFYIIGQGLYNDFDNNVIGMKAGEEKTFDLIWDKETNQKATFTVKIHMGIKIIPATLDDELAKKLGFETFDAFRQEVSGAAAKKLIEFDKNYLNEQLVVKLVDANEVDVPDWLVEYDAQKLANQYRMVLEKADEESKKIFYTKAKERIKIGLILDAIKEAEPDVQFTDTELINVIRNKAIQDGKDPNKTIMEFVEKKELLGVKEGIRQDLIFEFLIKNSNIVE